MPNDEETKVGAARRRLKFAEAELKEALQEAAGGHLVGGEAARAGLYAGQTVPPVEREPDLDWIFSYHPPPVEREPDLDWIFSYHPPSFADHPRYTAIRSAAKYFAQVILDNAPNCADRTAAIRHVRDAVMTANASIALGGRT